jgi:hypothetical protein
LWEKGFRCPVAQAEAAHEVEFNVFRKDGAGLDRVVTNLAHALKPIGLIRNNGWSTSELIIASNVVSCICSAYFTTS